MYTLQYEAVSILDYTVSNGMMITEQSIRKNVERSGNDPF
jgi:hypothetical protein